MSIFDSAYYRTNKKVLTLIGQWPFQPLAQRNYIRCIVLFMICSILTPKVIKLVEMRHDVDKVIECLPMIGLHIVSIFKYSNWIINTGKMKTLLSHIQDDWDKLTFNEDLEIMYETCERGRWICKAYTTAMFSILILYLSSPAVPTILDFVYPVNGTRGRIYLYQTEYFVDPDDYYLPILIHAYLTVPISVGVIVFVDNMFATYIHHACGMLKRLRSHLESMHIVWKDEGSNETKSHLIYKRIVSCATMHKNVITFISELESSGTMTYIIVLSFNLFMMTVTGIVTVMKLDQPNEAMKFLAFTLGEVFHLFFSSYQGQELINYSETVGESVYLSEWYTFPPNLQRLLIPIMMKGIIPCQVTAGSLYVISMGTFSIVIKNAMSFFTMLSSIR